MNRLSPHNKRRGFQVLPAILALSLAGCGSNAIEDENVILLEKEAEPADYNLCVANMGDVSQIEKIKCTYEQVNEQDVSFGVSGKRITEVYVEKGDAVKKGQLLAELGSDSLKERIEVLDYQIARNKLLLKQLIETEENGASYVYNQTGDQEQADDYLGEQKKLHKYTKEDYEDSIEVDELELASLQKELSYSQVYASMDGIVADVKKDLEGSTCRQGEVIFKILDNSECIFAVTDTQYKDYFKEGETVPMSITFGAGTGSYELTPYHMNTWNDKLYFSISEQPDTAVLEVGDTGSIELTLEEKKNVLCLPAAAVHVADDQEYVYVLNENNLREVLWVETGLHGNDNVEILTNLAEGDKVILK